MYDSNEQLRTLDQKIEDATLKLLSIDQQHANVQKFHQAEQSSIEQLQPIKADLEKAVEALTLKKVATNLSVETATAELERINKDIEVAKTNLANVEAEIDSTLNEMAQKEVILQGKLDNVDSRGNAVTMRELAVEEKEKNLAEKDELIKQLARKL